MKKKFANDNEVEKMAAVWRSAVNSRFLYNNKHEYSELLRKNVSKMYEIDDSRTIEDIYQRFTAKCKEETGYPLQPLLEAYREASEIYLSKDFWGGRRETRQAFAMKLFIKRHMQPSPAVAKLTDEISNHEKDDEIMARFFSSYNERELIDVCFSVLLARKIIIPFTEGPRNYKGPNKELFLVFLKDLNERLKGMVNVYENPVVIEDHIAELESGLYVLTVAKAWGILNDIGCVLRNQSIESILYSSFRSYSVNLPGIWIDDCDMGKTRFWIFPSNYKMAFCYSFKNANLRLTPYEFCIYSHDEDSVDDVCVMVTPEGNEQMMCKGHASTSQIVYADFEVAGNEGTNIITEVTFTPLNKNYGCWFAWKKFIKLEDSNPLHERFSSLLADHYNEEPMVVVKDVWCDYRWMIESPSSLVAIDKEFLYLWDMDKDADRGIRRHYYLAEKEEEEFEYIYRNSPAMSKGLLGLEVSESRPLYRLLRNDSQYQHLDRYFVNLSIEEQDEYEKFKEVVRNTEFMDQISIYTIKRRDKTFRRLCFNRYSMVFNLDKVLSHFGVSKLTNLKITFG